ncbi:MAG: EAL domain-containing protein [Pseudomonadota bacterium]
MFTSSNFLRGDAVQRQDRSEQARPRVLIVEDEALIACDLERRLDRLGFESVGMADNRDDALELFRTMHPDLVLMDISIRGSVDGIDTARAMLEFADTAVVFLTAYADNATVARASELSPYGYIAKPFDERTLGATCKVAVARHATDRDLRVLAHVASRAPIGLVVAKVVGDERQIVFANDAFERITGVTVDSVLGNRPGFLAEESSAACVARLAAAVDNLTDARETIQGWRPDGQPMWSIVSVSPVVGPTVRASHLVILYADVTRERQAMDAVAELQHTELVGRFSAAICNDFNNFLSVVLSYANLVLHAVNDPDVQHDVGQIVMAAGKGMSLTRQLLDFARFDEKPVAARTDLSIALRDARTRLKVMAGPACRVRFELPEDPIWIRLSTESIEQILLKLVANARDSMPDGGAIVITAFRPGEPSKEPGAGASIRIEVSDSGCGIDPAILDRVFEPFFTTKARDLGSGLGLARCRMLVERAGGSIRLLSAKGGGTKAVIELPTVEEPATDTTGSSLQLATVNAHGASCLLVVPDESLRAAYARALSMVGFAVTEASTGQAAIEMIDVLGNTLDLLVCTAFLPPGPVEEGLEVAARARIASPECRAIVATGVTDRHHTPPGDHVRLLDMPLSGWTLARHALELLSTGSNGPKSRNGAARMPESGAASAAAADASLALPGESRAGEPSEALTIAAAEIEAVDRALEESLAGLHVLFQPIVHAEDGSPYGHEALMRSLGPFKRPSELLAASERLDRVEDLGRAVRRCIADAISNDPGLNHCIFVNLHPKEFRAGLLAGLDEPLLPFASRIVWEVTERDQLSYSDDLANTQQALRAAGYRVAIDDLGEGYASLSWLVRLVPDIAKLDLSLVRDIDQSQIKRDLVGAIVDACHKGGTLVVAEGVETLAEAAVLRDLNCDLLQGHLFARPAPPFSDFG